MTAAVPSLRQQLSQLLGHSGCDSQACRYKAERVGILKDILPLVEAWGDARVAAARAEDCNEATKTALRALHWMTLYADGPFKGLPCCGCCAWLDGIRKPWPCDTLQAVGFTDDDIPAEFRAARSVPGTTP